MIGPRISRTVRNWPVLAEMGVGAKNCSPRFCHEDACRGAEKQKGLQRNGIRLRDTLNSAYFGEIAIKKNNSRPNRNRSLNLRIRVHRAVNAERPLPRYSGRLFAQILAN